MANHTLIEWTNATWNPVTGCTKISAGCDNCYAERLAERFRGVEGHPFSTGFDLKLRPERLEQPLRWRRPQMIFVNSMSDLFHKEVPFDYVDRVFDTMEAARWHVFQVLTKRSSRMRDYVRARYGEQGPPPHVWLGTSIEDGMRLSRVRHLRQTPVLIRFLSIEPLIGPVGELSLDGIGWVIVGGESGPRARRIDPQWVRDIRDQCLAADVPFFFKQWGGLRPKSGGRILDGREWNQWPRTLGPQSGMVPTRRTLGQVSNLEAGMAAPKTTIWTLDPHTRAKHAILKRYLQAWTPILTQTGFKQIAYIDGFAGPGRYVGGEEGSPIIALRAALDHSARINSTVMFLFVEKDPERARVLEEIIDSMLLPSNFFVRIDGGITFEDSFEKFIRNLRSRNQNLPPIFAFIDPFGWTGAPFNIVKFILGQKSCEVLITFMYEEINRFIGHPDQIGNFDTFFGTGDWRECLILSKPKERNRFLHELYLSQLKTVARARYVRSFQMRNESGLIDYYLFYATNSLRGLQKMKEAIWKIDESGEFTFLDATDPNQTVLFSKEPRYEDLKRQILSRFSGQEITVGEIEEFVLAETAFRDTHYKVQVLKPLERAHPPRIQIIDAPPNRKHGTFGSSLMRLRFI